jgi:hypothetical protein
MGAEGWNSLSSSIPALFWDPSRVFLSSSKFQVLISRMPSLAMAKIKTSHGKSKFPIAFFLPHTTYNVKIVKFSFAISAAS